jgi:hypothetical protein
MLRSPKGKAITVLIVAESYFGNTRIITLAASGLAQTPGLDRATVVKPSEAPHQLPSASRRSLGHQRGEFYGAQ